MVADQGGAHHRDRRSGAHRLACGVAGVVLAVELIRQTPARDRPRSGALGPSGPRTRRGGGAAPGRTAIQR